MKSKKKTTLTKKKPWKRIGAVVLAFATALTTLFSGVMTQNGTETVDAATNYNSPPADGSTVYLYHNSSSRITYGDGYSTNQYYTYDDEQQNNYVAYCADPNLAAPANGYYTIDYDVYSYTNHTVDDTHIDEIVYVLPGQPGYDTYGVFQDYVSTYFGSKDWNGNSWSYDSYYVLAHLLISYLLDCDLDTVFYGTSDEFQSYFSDAYNANFSGHGYGENPLRVCLSDMATAMWQTTTISVPSDYLVFMVKTNAYSSSYQNIIGTYYPKPVTDNYTGAVMVTKSSSNTSISSGSLYDLSGAVYYIYSSGSTTNNTVSGYLGSVTTGSDGTSGTYTVDLGSSTSTTVYIQEHSVPTNGSYTLSDKVYSATVTSDSTTSVPVDVAVTDTPVYTTSLTLVKTDADLGSTSAGGDTTLAGAVFEVDYYAGGNYTTNAQVASATRTRRWYIETAYNSSTKEYEAKLDSSHLSGSYSSSSLYTNASGTAVMPLGTYVVTEVKASNGYKTDGAKYTAGVEINKPDYISKLTQAQGNATLKGAVFTIYNESDHAVYIDKNGDGTPDTSVAVGSTVGTVTTDANGYATLKGAVYDIKNVSKHSVLVNNVLYETGKVVMELTTDENGYAYTGDRALPYGTYEVYEVKATDYGYLENDYVATVYIREDGKT